MHHPLSLSENRSAENVRASLKNVEAQKLNESESLCHQNGWLFSPMAWHPWAGVGPHGAAIRGKLEKELAGDLQGWPRRNYIRDFRAKLSFALMTYVAKQLRAAEDAIAEPNIVDLMAPPFMGGDAFSPAELAQWEDEEEEVFIGPVRIRGVRPSTSSRTSSAL